MSGSLFSLSTVAQIKQPEPLQPLCGKCKLFLQCKTPKMKPSGRGSKRVLLVGEAPADDEDDEGRPFVGKTGEKLRRILTRIGVDMREDCWIVNSLSCKPPKRVRFGKAEWLIDEAMVEFCRPLVTDAIRRFDPEVIIPLGKRATRSVLGPLWGEDTKGIVRWAGYQIPARRPNAWICPTFHPSFVLHREESDRGLSEKYLESHLEAAFALKGRPWEEVPDYSIRVKLVYDDLQAAGIIKGFTAHGRPVAFDYETTCLKPDGPDAKIVCCSISDGETTIAYPWLGKAREATGELLKSGVPLIGSNMKFEIRWTMKEFGFPPAGFKNGWDTMTTAHLLDPRHGITGLKFQAFRRFGVEDYSSHVEPFLASKVKGGNETNRVKEIDLKSLLLYCGTDSLMEWMVAYEQMGELGVRLG